MKLFLQKNANFSSAGGLAPSPQTSASCGWGLSPQTPIDLRRLGALPPDPQHSPPIANFWLRAWGGLYLTVADPLAPLPTNNNNQRWSRGHKAQGQGHKSRQRGRMGAGAVFTTTLIEGSGFNPHPSHVVAYSDKTLYNDYLCLVASNKAGNSVDKNSKKSTGTGSSETPNQVRIPPITK